MNDADLLQAFIDTEKSEYFGELYSRYTPLVYGMCLKYLRNTEEAEDAVMQLFEELLHKVGRYYIADFRPWLYSVTRNHCLQQLRRRRPEEVRNFPFERMESDDMAHLLSSGEREKKLAKLEDCLDKLPDAQRICIRMFFFEERSYADVADAANFQMKSVKSYIQNGKRNLKKCIEESEIA